MSVDLNKRHSETVDPINVYAVISLVAALVGLFPVAIVFGVLAFWRPAGRGVALAGVSLGVLEALAVALLVYGVGTGLTPDDSIATAVDQNLSLPATQFEAPSTVFTVPLLTTAPPTQEPAEATREPAIVPPAVDDLCDPAVDNHATSADGQFMKCAYAGRSTARWVRSAPIIAYADQGASCDPSTPGIAVSPEGLDMVCVSDTNGEGGYWIPGP